MNDIILSFERKNFTRSSLFMSLFMCMFLDLVKASVTT